MKQLESWRFWLLEVLDLSDNEQLEYVFLLLRQRDSLDELERRLEFELCESDETDLEASLLRDELEILLGSHSYRSCCCEFS